jgi:N-acetylglucosaminyldiphosphoundecaprenol N-acetyl-beta-D-mannosaminyltransferase
MTESIKIEKTTVLGIPLYASDIASATQLIVDECRKNHRHNYLISATGAHGLVFARKHMYFEQTLKNFHINLPDGMPGVWVGRLKGASKMKRCYGPAFFASVMQSSKDLPINHFFCGGNAGVAVELRTAVAKKFSNGNVVDTYCPPFREVNSYDYEAIAKQINDSGANIVWIGLSTPKQELFATNLSRFTNAHFIITVGAAFDFHTDKVKQAPSFLQKAGLEWFFRLMMEPKRLYRRYLEIVPMFIYYNLKDFFNFAKK